MIALSLLASCRGGNASVSRHDADTIAMRHAVNLTLVDYGDFTVAKIRNPWDTLLTLQTYVLVPKDREMPSGVPDGQVVRVPLERSVVYTAVHSALIEELGALDAVTGVCDARFINRGSIKERIAGGEIVDCGLSMSPNLEKIIMLNPEAIVLSAFENSNDHNKVAQMGIPIIDCAEYMETSPLGRAEWMKFFGRLYGKGETADSLFEVTEREYTALRTRMAGVTERPSVLLDLIYGQSWSQPCANSTIGILIRDAGGSNPFDGYRRSGSVQLAPEEVLYTASDADIWLVRYSQDRPLTLSQMARDNKLYTRFVPYKTGNIYGCNTGESTYYEETPFHPQWLLAEYVRLIHPEAGIETPRRYFTKLEP